MTNTTDGVMVLLADNHGIYIPKLFAEQFCTQDNIENNVIKGIDSEQIEILKNGPELENEQYWDIWDEVLQECNIEFGNNVYILYQDGDLSMICFDQMSPEEYKNLEFDDDCDYRHFEEDELVHEFEQEMNDCGVLDKTDNIAMSEEFNNWMDSLHEDGQVTNYQVQNFSYPDDE